MKDKIEIIQKGFRGVEEKDMSGDSSENLYTKKQHEYVNNVPDNMLRAHLLYVTRARDILSEDRDKALVKVYKLEERLRLVTIGK